MPMGRFRLIDTAGSELDVVELDDRDVREGALLPLPGGRDAEIVEIYDDDDGRSGDVDATLVLDV
jgi:hypothetical protein